MVASPQQQNEIKHLQHLGVGLDGIWYRLSVVSKLDHVMVRRVHNVVRNVRDRWCWGRTSVLQREGSHVGYVHCVCRPRRRRTFGGRKDVLAGRERSKYKNREGAQWRPSLCGAGNYASAPTRGESRDSSALFRAISICSLHRPLA